MSKINAPENVYAPVFFACTTEYASLRTSAVRFSYIYLERDRTDPKSHSPIPPSGRTIMGALYDENKNKKCFTCVRCSLNLLWIKNRELKMLGAGNDMDADAVERAQHNHYLLNFFVWRREALNIFFYIWIWARVKSRKHTHAQA